MTLDELKVLKLRNQRFKQFTVPRTLSFPHGYEVQQAATTIDALLSEVERLRRLLLEQDL